MKKIIFIFALIASTYSYSQTLKYVNFVAFEFEDDTCFIGDSALVTIKYTNNMTEQDTLVFCLQHVYEDNTVSGLTTIAKIGFIPKIHNIPLDVNGNKSFKIKIPNHATGDTRVLITSHPTQVQKRPDFYLEPQVISGLVDYFKESKVEIMYFDLLGNKIEKPTSGLFIWVNNKGQSGKIFIKD
jgi:hypothetical protein